MDNLTSEAKQAIEEYALKTNTMLFSRAGLLTQAGLTHAGKRDLYKECGYKQTLEWRDFYSKFKRNSVAKRIIESFPESTWAQYPLVYEDDTLEDTPFEKQWAKIARKLKVFPKFVRADKMAGIHEYAVIVLGFNDNKDISQKVTNATELIYMRPVMQTNADIGTYYTDPNNEKYGQPETYNITFNSSDGTTTKVISFHESRILHIADNILDDEYKGTSRLECVFNRLQDIETVMGASAEMVWKQSFPGINFKADPEADMSQGKEELKTEIDNFMHGLSRYMKLQGVDVQEIKGIIQDPTPVLDCILKLIATETKIPVRILTGSEEAKLASGTDKQNYQDRVTQRREHFAIPFILEPFIDLLMEVGVLPTVEYKTRWDDAYAMTQKDRIEIAQGITKALANYAKTPGLDLMITPEWYLIKVLKYKKEELVGLDLGAYVSFVQEEREFEMEKAMDTYVLGEENKDNPEDANRDVEGDITN